jgi:DNA polymerase-3 subunit chi
MHQDVLVNLSGTIPSFFSRFDRVAEIVPEVESTRESARENYRQYKSKGYPLHYHKLSS